MIKTTSIVATLAGSALVTTAAVGNAGTTRNLSIMNKLVRLEQLRVPSAMANALLENARPYKKELGASSSLSFSSSASSHLPPGVETRNLDQYNNNYGFDGSYSIKFSRCVDVKLLDEDLFGEEVISYTKKGQIVSTKSYVLFHVCKEGDGSCYYQSEDDLYLIDLSTYVKNLASYHVNIKSSYCGACEMYYDDYCAAEDGNYGDDAVAAANDDAAAAEGDDAAAFYARDDDEANANVEEGVEEEEVEDGAEDKAEDEQEEEDKREDEERGGEGAEDNADRKLKGSTRQRRTAKSYIDCDQCLAYGCMNSNDNGEDYDSDDVIELIRELSSCMDTGLSWNDEDLYVGFMCSSYNGDGVELAVFLDNQCTAYTTLKAVGSIYDTEQGMLAEAETYIKNAFTETTSCLDKEFGDPAYDYADEDDDGYEMDYYCKNLFRHGPVSFNNCDDYQNENSGNNRNYEDGSDKDYSWYKYDMNYDDIRNLDEVCVVLQGLDGEYHYQYDDDKSGTWNEHSLWEWRRHNGGMASIKQDLMIVLYVVLGFLTVVATWFCIRACDRKRKQRMLVADDSTYDGGKSRREGRGSPGRRKESHRNSPPRSSARSPKRERREPGIYWRVS